MSLGDNKALVRRFIDEVMNSDNFAAIADLCVPGSLFARGTEHQIRVMKTAFPDNRFAIDDMVAEGEKVAVQVTIKGTNSGPMGGLPAFGRLEVPVPPSGKSVTATGIFIFKISKGKILGYASELDQIGMLRQLGWTFLPPGET
jgi:predicted ester cyclase